MEEFSRTDMTAYWGILIFSGEASWPKGWLWFMAKTIKMEESSCIRSTFCWRNCSQLPHFPVHGHHDNSFQLDHPHTTSDIPFHNDYLFKTENGDDVMLRAKLLGSALPDPSHINSDTLWLIISIFRHLSGHLYHFEVFWSRKPAVTFIGASAAAPLNSKRLRIDDPRTLSLLPKAAILTCDTAVCLIPFWVQLFFRVYGQLSLSHIFNRLSPLLNTYFIRPSLLYPETTTAVATRPIEELGIIAESKLSLTRSIRLLA